MIRRGSGHRGERVGLTSMARGRRGKNIEFFSHLRDILDCKNDHDFAKKIGKAVPNVNSYLSGRKTPGRRVLISALHHAFEWHVEPKFEVQPIEEHKLLPHEPGVYCLYDSSGSVIYVGQATDLKQEVYQTLQRKMNFPVRLGPQGLAKKFPPKHKIVAEYLTAYIVRSARMRHNLEAFLLRCFPNQSHNNKMGNFR